MAIRWVVFDIGGILEVISGGGDPVRLFAEMEARWETRLGMPPGDLSRRQNEMFERLASEGKRGSNGTLTEAEWLAELQRLRNWEPSQIDAYLRDFWDVYCGNPNTELVAFLGSLRPRYKTALLSNSFVGAQREEEARMHFSELVDEILYSHELGCSKPEPRIFALTCERLGARPEEIVFLDDLERNVAAAKACGIHAILYRDNAQAIDEILTCLHAHAT